MGHVFISKFNSHRFVQEIKDVEIDFRENPYSPVELFFLTEREKNSLAAYGIFLKDPQLFVDKYFVKLKDTFSFVYERPPSFHKSSTCPFLQSDFENIFIPEKIKSVKSDNLLKAFRKWCLQHQQLFHNNRLAFIAQCCLAFSKYELTESDFLGVERRNKKEDSKKYDNIDLDELNEEISKINTDFWADINSSKMKKDIYEKFKNRLFLGSDKYTVDDIKYNNSLYERHEIKAVLNGWYVKYIRDALQMLRTWLQAKMNKELRFEGKILEQLGFRNCKSCYPDFVSTVSSDFYDLSPSSTETGNSQL
ncbi:hypothetical protein GCM10028818_36050 [Spirosoma horti]